MGGISWLTFLQLMVLVANAKGHNYGEENTTNILNQKCRTNHHPHRVMDIALSEKVCDGYVRTYVENYYGGVTKI